jgi:hypothetical protein
MYFKIMEEFKENLPLMPNEQLCEVIVAFRYLGTLKEEAILAMTELAERRTNGDIFEYEKRIEEILQSLPKINIDLNKILKTPKII